MTRIIVVGAGSRLSMATAFVKLGMTVVVGSVSERVNDAIQVFSSSLPAPILSRAHCSEEKGAQWKRERTGFRRR